MINNREFSEGLKTLENICRKGYNATERREINNKLVLAYKPHKKEWDELINSFTDHGEGWLPKVPELADGLRAIRRRSGERGFEPCRICNEAGFVFWHRNQKKARQPIDCICGNATAGATDTWKTLAEEGRIETCDCYRVDGARVSDLIPRHDSKE